MEFASLMDETQNMWGTVIAISGFAVCLILMIAAIIMVTKSDKLSTILFMSGFVLFMISFSLGVAMAIQTNPENLEGNIKQKYEIESIDLTSDAYEVSPLSPDSQIVKVELLDGTDALFVLTQNTDTWEPTLDNLPTNSGEPGTADISVQDITK